MTSCPKRLRTFWKVSSSPYTANTFGEVSGYRRAASYASSPYLRQIESSLTSAVSVYWGDRGHFVSVARASSAIAARTASSSNPRRSETRDNVAAARVANTRGEINVLNMPPFHSGPHAKYVHRQRRRSIEHTPTHPRLLTAGRFAS